MCVIIHRPHSPRPNLKKLSPLIFPAVHVYCFQFCLYTVGTNLKRNDCRLLYKGISISKQE